MTRSEHLEQIGVYFREILETFESKNLEYASENSIFKNFEAISAAEGITRERAAWFLMMKHWESVRRMTEQPGEIPEYILKEKFTDLVSYMWLIRSMLSDRS